MREGKTKRAASRTALLVAGLLARATARVSGISWRCLARGTPP